MRVLTFDDTGSLAEAAAGIVAATVRERPDAALALPTGRTAIPFYDALARRREAGLLDLSHARGFNLDELVVPPAHPASFRTFMREHAWGRTGLAPERGDMPRAADDLTAECARYDRVLLEAGTIDLAVLGIGRDGHVGYNLPGATVRSTHVVEVPETVADELGIAADARPLRAVTMGLGPLRAARRLLLMAIGAEKRDAVRALVEGPADPLWPASLLRDHPEFDVLLTREAVP